MDQEKIKSAVKLLLEGIGEDVNREGLLETPDRISRMYEEICAGYNEDPAITLSKVFSVYNSEEETDNHEMVLEKDITFYSLCEHHLMPFFGKAHIAYIPKGRVVGISKLARTVDIYAKRLQIQERMTGQIADAIMDNLDAEGVMVVLEAEHLCMTMRGAKKPGSKTVTVATRGVFRNNSDLSRQFFDMVK